MSVNYHIRGVDESVDKQLDEICPASLSKNQFYKEIFAEYVNRTYPLPLFDSGRKPELIVHGLPFKFIDLFAGIGGFRCALSALGGECVFTSEWDKYAVKTYQAWYGVDDVYDGDIRDLDLNLIPEHDVLCAGFPCQPFSLAGVSKKNSLGRKHGFEDEHQGNLFFSILKIIDDQRLRPPVLFLENVPNLKSHDKGRTWSIIKEELEARDYEVYSQIIDASRWVPQKRRRIFIVCFDRGIFGRDDQIGFKWPEPNAVTGPVLGDILETEPDTKYMLSDKLWRYLQDYAQKHRDKGNGFGYGLNGKNDIARTMSARYHKDGSEILIDQEGWQNPRRLTPTEAQKLMGYDGYAANYGFDGVFPSDVVSDTQAYRQFGNSVVPQAVEFVGREIVKAMNKGLSTTDNGCILKGRKRYPSD